MFISDEPVTSAVLAQALGADRPEVDAWCEELARGYEERGAGITLRNVAGGWRLTTHPEAARSSSSSLALAARPADEGRARDALDRRVQAAGHPAPDLGDPRGELEGVLRALVDRGLVAEVGRRRRLADRSCTGRPRSSSNGSVCPRSRPCPRSRRSCERCGQRGGRDGRHRLTGMPVERLQRSLARAGFGSRRACEELIAAGRVEINGRRRRWATASIPRATRFGSTARRSTSTPSSARSPCTSRGRDDDDARPARRTGPQPLPPQGRPRVPGRSPGPGHRGALAAHQRRRARASADASAVRDREGVPGGSGPASVEAAAPARLRRGVELDDGTARAVDALGRGSSRAEEASAS